MTKRRRTSGIQRRERASSEALNRRIDAGASGGGASLPDWRLLAIGGVLLIGVILIVLVIVLGGEPDPNLGVQEPNDGGTHVADGTDCRAASAPCGPDPYSSMPATSGPHWGTTPANWGVYSTPQPESQVIHNLEHGGIVIWYDAEAVTDAEVDEMASYVEGQVGYGSRRPVQVHPLPVGRRRGSRRRRGRHRVAAPARTSTQWTWTPFAPSPTGTT